MAEDNPSQKIRIVLVMVLAVVGVPVVFAALIGVSSWNRGGGAVAESPSPVPAEAGYVGVAACRACHEAEFDAWRGSHHDLAMQPADGSTVLGDFNDTAFEHRGAITRFFRRGEAFLIEADALDDAGGVVRREYEVAYTFGVTPLQQYLIGLPDGRYQALTVAWDTRRADDGGQRWFHLYPDEDTPPGDALHWASPAHNWNYACADCHSTNLRKNYDAASDTFDTAWAEMDVSCEACHGPGSRHVTLAVAAEENPGAVYPADHGLVIRPTGPGAWAMPEGALNAGLARPHEGDSEVESCGRCHARRSQLAEYTHGSRLDETHWVELLGDRLYHPDGQILDEVYVYGSFKQSKMHALGVTCSDCHDPHSLSLRKAGNALCNDCHAAGVYDTPEHHHHEAGTPGASCVECHMPERTYMVVDPRRDHSIRVPRPDLTVDLGVPNACTRCHDDRDARWAADAVVEWYGQDRKPGYQTFARTLHAARAGEPGSIGLLSALANNPAAPSMARATALRELASSPTPAVLPMIQAGLESGDPLMRRAAAEALVYADAQTRWRMLSPLLRDAVPVVRIAAAMNLLDIDPDRVEAAMRQPLRVAIGEFVASHRFNADRAESWTNLARYHEFRGKIEEAERDYAEARRRDPRYLPAYANQADLYRSLGRENDAERVLREGIAHAPGGAILRHSLGLLLVRTQRHAEAITELELATHLDPGSARFGYVYGVALESLRGRAAAIGVWSRVLERHPNDREVLRSLAAALAKQGEPARALEYAERLLAFEPDSESTARLVDSLRRATQPP